MFSTKRNCWCIPLDRLFCQPPTIYPHGGQTLYVTEGRGLVQVRGEQAVEMHAGDVVHAPDGEEHWHGATPDDFMTHLSITEGAPHWGAHVSDDEYGAAQPDRTR